MDFSRVSRALSKPRIGSFPYRSDGKLLARDAETGAFKDVDLATLLMNATDNPAGAFKARGIPEVMRIVEIMGIEQARQWGTCTVRYPQV